MNKQNERTEQLFETIVTTLMSSQEVQPCIIREHISRYAEAADVSYTLARQAVVWAVTERIRAKLVQI